MRRFSAFFLLPLLLGGCDLLGIETASQIDAKKEAEGRAIGSACRHAVRSIEDCYMQNPKANKASVFAGWREMDEYMRENNVAGMPFSDKVLPTITETTASAKDKPDAAKTAGAPVPPRPAPILPATNATAKPPLIELPARPAGTAPAGGNKPASAPRNG